MNKNVRDAVAIAVQAQCPVGIESDPGMGKTAFMDELAAFFSTEAIRFIGSCRSPEDIGGYPMMDYEAKTIRLVPAGEWKQRLLELAEQRKNENVAAILFLDEFSCWPPAMQAPGLALIHERRAGDIVFPRNVVPVAAMNPMETAAGGYDRAAPLANRLITLHWPHDPKATISGFLNGWESSSYPVLPKDWRKNIPWAVNMVTGFLHKFPNLVHALPKEESKRSQPWPSNRTWWEFAIPCMAACKAVNASEDVEALLLAGSVGEAAAMPLLSWRRDLDLADPEELLKDPKKFKIYDRQDKTFVTINSVVSAVLSDMTKPRWKAAWQIINACATQGQKDLAAMGCRELAKAKMGNPELRNYPSVDEEIKPFIPLLRAAGLYRAS